MKGILFVGDPQVSSRRPGRRKDDYLASVLQKLDVAASVARDEDLLPVISGDLFDRAAENDLATLARLVEVLKRFPTVPLCPVGNHDKLETLLTRTDALYLLALAGVVEVFDGPVQLARSFETPAGAVNLWVAPYGAALPDRLERSDAAHVLLITHHDLAFEGAYPGAAPLREIVGCDLAINGHMHKTAPSVILGRTAWHCPGNIEPLSVDCREHEPAVWIWRAGSPYEKLERVLLPHERDCFDLTGLRVSVSLAEAAVDALSAHDPIVRVSPIEPPPSHFADLLAAQTTLEMARTADAATFIEELKAALAELQTSEPVARIILSLAPASDAA